MDWRSRFNSAFFAAWQGRALPGGPRIVAEYRAERQAVLLPPRVLEWATVEDGPLAQVLLHRVYAFGALTGRAFAEMLGADAAPRCEAFCGSFNLGISLFDWLCDEKGEVGALLAAPPFNALAGDCDMAAAVMPDGPVHALLRDLAEAVLTEMARAVGPPGPRADPLWRQIGEMMAAQATIARSPIERASNMRPLRAAARLKSSGPFRLMAEWAALAARADRAKAAATGLAVGDLFWLADDAKDLWEDIDAARWNLVLAAAAGTDPALMRFWGDPEFEFRLSAILLRPGWAESLIAPVLDGVAGVVQGRPGDLLAASVETWLT